MCADLHVHLLLPLSPLAERSTVQEIETLDLGQSPSKLWKLAQWLTIAMALLESGPSESEGPTDPGFNGPYFAFGICSRLLIYQRPHSASGFDSKTRFL